MVHLGDGFDLRERLPPDEKVDVFAEHDALHVPIRPSQSHKQTTERRVCSPENKDKRMARKGYERDAHHIVLALVELVHL